MRGYLKNQNGRMSKRMRRGNASTDFQYSGGETMGFSSRRNHGVKKNEMKNNSIHRSGRNNSRHRSGRNNRCRSFITQELADLHL